MTNLKSLITQTRLGITMQLPVAVVLLGFVLTTHAFGLDVVYDPLNVAQTTLSAARMSESVLNQATQIKNQIQSIQFAAKNLERISDYKWRDITNLSSQLREVVRSGQGISHAMQDFQVRFDNRYPDYANQKQGPIPDFQTTYRTWDKTTLSTIESSLRSIGIISNSFDNEENLMRQLKEQGKTARGRMQVLQTTAEISAETVNQMQELKRIVASQADSQNAYLAYKVSKASYNEKALAEITDKIDTSAVEYKDNPAFGTIKGFGGAS